MNNKKLIVILALLVILIFIVNILIYFRLSSILEINKIDSSIIVAENIGFDLNKSMLSFGKVFPGGSSSRIMSLTNNFDYETEVSIYGVGDIRYFIESKVELIDPGVIKKINIVAIVPDKTDFGIYEGKVIIEVRKSF